MIHSSRDGDSVPDLALLTDEIVERFRQGETIDIESLVDRYPQHAEALHDLLPMMELLADLSQPPENAGDAAPSSDPLPRELGDFRIVREIGRGGMGVVYEARQLSLNRRAALKVLPFASLFEDKQLARFKNEAQAAASLDHENIVHAYAVGVDRGIHYFAMQYVEGKNLAEVISELRRSRGVPTNPDSPEGEEQPRPCSSGGETSSADEHQTNGRSTVDAGLGSTLGELSGREYFKTIARLIAKAAEALDYAHQRGVVHRDIKPSNLLVDANQKIYVADFGLASIEGNHNVTTTGDVLGTLRYMSPEQAAGDTRRIDHRTDIYSLGTTLYEVAALRPAFDNSDRVALLRQITTDDLPAMRTLNRRIPRDLETIVIKAMSKDPADRYATAAELAADLRRFAEDQPILARPPNLTQQVARWARQRTGTLIAMTVVMFLVSIVSTTAAGLIWYERNQAEAARNNAVTSAAAARAAEALERQQRMRAEQAEREEREQRIRAEQAEANAQATLKYLTTALRSPDPKRDGHTVTVVEVLDQAVESMGDDQLLNPLQRAAVLEALGETFVSGLGLGDKAVGVLEQAVELHKAHSGVHHADTAHSMHMLAKAYHSAGRFEQAIELFSETLALVRQIHGPAHRNTLVVMSNLAGVYDHAGRTDEAIETYEQALNLERTNGNAESLACLHGLAEAYHSAGRYAASVETSERVLELLTAKLGSDHPDTLAAMNNVGGGYFSVGRTKDAIDILDQALKLTASKFGPEHPNTLVSMGNLAIVFRSVGRIEEAVQLNESALQIMKDKLGADHPATLTAMNNLATAYGSAGRLAEEVECLEEVVEIMMKKLGPDHPGTLNSMHNLALAYVHARRLAEGIDLCEKCLAIQRKQLGAKHPKTLLSMHNLAGAYREAGRLPQAIELSEECAALLREELGPNHPDTLSARNILFGAYMAASRFEDAFGLSEETLQLTRERLDAEPQNSLALAGSLANHAQVLLRLEDWEKAESVLRECLEIREQHSPESWLTFNIRCVLGGVLLQLDKCEEAEPLLLDGYRGMHLRESAIPQDGKERLREAILSLVKLYETKDIPEEAAHWRAKLDETQGRQDPPAPERESPLPSAESTGQQKAAAPESSEQGQGNATMHTEPAQP